MWNGLFSDIRYAGRQLLQSWTFTVAAILTLALGIGANTAIFSVINEILLRPLPWTNPDRLVSVRESSPQFADMSIAYLNFVDWKERSRLLTGLSIFRGEEMNLTGTAEPDRLVGRMITADYFSVLNVKPVIGRFPTAEESKAGGPPVAVLGEGVWKRLFGGNSSILGRSLTLNGKAHTVIGVAPRDMDLEEHPDVYTPLAQWDSAMIKSREFHPGLRGVARLAPGVGIEQARAEMAAIAGGLAQQYPATNAAHGVVIQRLEDRILGDVRPTLWVLLGAVAFVLLICCANVANLILARSTVRQREIAIRAALGAGRGRLLRHMISESLLLSGCGAVFGALIASWGSDAIPRLVPGGLPRLETIEIDGRVLLFTVGIAILTGVLFGLAPAIHAARIDLNAALRESGRGSTGARGRLRDALVVAEVALAMVLLVGAGLMLRTVWSLYRVQPGFDPSNVLTFNVALSPTAASSADSIRLALPQLIDRVRTVAGVQHAAINMDLPMTGDSEVPLYVKGRPKPATQGDATWALLYPVSPDYLATMKIPLVRGRFFDDHDNNKSETVCVIDEDFAKSAFPGMDPVGQRLDIALPGPEGPGIRIVGVAGHVKHWGLDEETGRVHIQFYLPWPQIPDMFLTGIGGTTFVVRTSVDPLTIVSAVKPLIVGPAKDQPVFDVRTMQQIVDSTTARQRFSTMLLGLFGAVALLLASVGIYGVISYSVAQRTREMGIRLALGAAKSQVLTLVLGRGAILAGLGLAIGTVAAIAVTRSMKTMIFGVSLTDPITFVVVGAVLLGVALLASWIPARAATKVDPILTLRYE